MFLGTEDSSADKELERNIGNSGFGAPANIIYIYIFPNYKNSSLYSLCYSFKIKAPTSPLDNERKEKNH